MRKQTKWLRWGRHRSSPGVLTSSLTRCPHPAQGLVAKQSKTRSRDILVYQGQGFFIHSLIVSRGRFKMNQKAPFGLLVTDHHGTKHHVNTAAHNLAFFFLPICPCRTWFPVFTRVGSMKTPTEQQHSTWLCCSWGHAALAPNFASCFHT